MLYKNFTFNIIKTAAHSRARLGQIITPHGIIETPNFIFCATRATLKTLTPQQIRACGTQVILSNTYHLLLQPGGALIEKLGGLHKFMAWDGPILTDSGGFQIFSLGHGSVADELKGQRRGTSTLLKINEEGATFRSYLDGRIFCLTPELSMATQRALGSDLVVVLDECTPFHVDKSYTEKSLQLSHRWAKRCLEEFICHDDGKQALYGVVQGGIYQDLRTQGTEFINNQQFFGHAIGGSLGMTPESMREIVAYTCQGLLAARPVHLLGIGGVQDILHGVQCGIDTFDCVHPTRIARHGRALIKRNNPHYQGAQKEHISLLQARFKNSEFPLAEDCPCYTCRTFSCGYLHHLFKAGELLALQALTIHNVAFMNSFLADIREGIRKDDLAKVISTWS